MSRLVVLAALWSPLAVAACCSPRTVDRPVIVRPPSCLTRPAPLPPAGSVPCDAAWAGYYVELSTWVVEVEASCGTGPLPIARQPTDDAPWQAGYP